MVRRSVLLATLVTTFAMLLAACTDAATDNEAEEGTSDEATETVDEPVSETNGEAEATDTVDQPDDVERTVGEDAVGEVLEDAGLESFPAEARPLDVSTLEVETTEGVFQAEEYDNAHVDALTDDIYIGVALGGRYAGEDEDVIVYLCDSDDVYEYLTGDLENGEATLQERDTKVELTVTEDAVTGTVVLNGEEPRSFTATEATGDAGMYQVAEQIDGEDSEVRFIVLPDGTQRGKVCVWVPHSNPPHRVCIPVKQK